MRRFVNADIVAGAISEAVTLNRFAYANGNPVSNIDPFGLAAVAQVSLGEADLDITDDYEHYGSGGGAGGGFYGYDPGVSSGGSYYNYLVRNNTANYDASRGGYHYQGTTTTVDTVGQYYVSGAVSVYDSATKPKWQNSFSNNQTNVYGKSHGSVHHKAGIDGRVKVMKESGEFTDIYVNKSLKSAGLKGSQRPDIIGRCRDGSYTYIEFASQSQASGTGLRSLEEKMRTMDEANGIKGELVNWGDY